jgi:hypothetical protein
MGMVSGAMVEVVTEDSIKDLDWHIHILLGCLKKLDEGMRTTAEKPRKPKWILCSNFLCLLLNLLETMHWAPFIFCGKVVEWERESFED